MQQHVAHTSTHEHTPAAAELTEVIGREKNEIIVGSYRLDLTNKRLERFKFVTYKI